MSQRVGMALLISLRRSASESFADAAQKPAGNRSEVRFYRPFLREKLSAWTLHLRLVSGSTAGRHDEASQKHSDDVRCNLLVWCRSFTALLRRRVKHNLQTRRLFTKPNVWRATDRRQRRNSTPTLTEEQHLDAILKGKKPEKPPNMPAYGEKGVTPEQAKALLEHMKQLKSAQ